MAGQRPVNLDRLQSCLHACNLRLGRKGAFATAMVQVPERDAGGAGEGPQIRLFGPGFVDYTRDVPDWVGGSRRPSRASGPTVQRMKDGFGRGRPEVSVFGMNEAQTAQGTGFTPSERAYIRGELDIFFSTLPSVAEGWRSNRAFVLKGIGGSDSVSAKEYLYGRKRRASTARDGTRTALYLRV